MDSNQTLLLLLLLLSRFSCVQLCATPQTAARQAPPRYENVHEDEKDTLRMGLTL